MKVLKELRLIIFEGTIFLLFNEYNVLETGCAGSPGWRPNGMAQDLNPEPSPIESGHINASGLCPVQSNTWPTHIPFCTVALIFDE